MNVERFKQVFDTLDEEGQRNVISQLSDEELSAVQNYKPSPAANPPRYPGAGQTALTALSQIAGFSKPEQTPPSVQEAGQFAGGAVYGLGKGTSEMYEGLRQGGLGVGEVLGMNSPGAQQRYTQETMPVRQGREQFVQSQPAPFQGGSSAGTFAAKVAPAFLVKQPQSVFGRIAAGGGVGGATGFMDFVDEGSNQSRPVNTGLGALVGAGLSAGFEAVTGLRNLAPNYIKGKLSSQTGKEGEAIEAATKVPLTFGQKTGDPMLQQLEQGIAPTTRTISERNKALNASVKSLTNTVRGIENKPEIVANNVKNALDDAVGAAQAKRKVIASYDYAKFKRATGGEDVISMDNAKAELAKIADEYKFGSSNMGRQAARLANTLDENVNAEQFLNLRARISDSLAGSGNLFKDIDKAVEKRIAARLMGAIESDITATSQYLTSQGNATAAELLSKATKNYAKNSEVIREIQDSTLGKLFKTDTFVPEKAAESLTKMQPSEIRRAFSILGKRSPEQVDEITSLWLHNAVRKSIGAPTKGAAESTIEPGNIVNTLLSKEHGGAAKLRAIIPDADKRAQVVKSVRALQRLADRSTPGTGATQSPASKGTELAGTIAGGAHPVFITRILSKILTPIGIRNSLLTDAGRKNLMILAEPVKNQAAYIAAANYFNELEQ